MGRSLFAQAPGPAGTRRSPGEVRDLLDLTTHRDQVHAVLQEETPRSRPPTTGQGVGTSPTGADAGPHQQIQQETRRSSPRCGRPAAEECSRRCRKCTRDHGHFGHGGPRKAARPCRRMSAPRTCTESSAHDGAAARAAGSFPARSSVASLLVQAARAPWPAPVSATHVPAGWRCCPGPGAHRARPATTMDVHITVPCARCLPPVADPGRAPHRSSSRGERDVLEAPVTSRKLLKLRAGLPAGELPRPS